MFLCLSLISQESCDDKCMWWGCAGDGGIGRGSGYKSTLYSFDCHFFSDKGGTLSLSTYFHPFAPAD